MGINSEKTISQRLYGSPAQIRADEIDLANVIFGSNSEAIVFGAKSTNLNVNVMISDDFGMINKSHHTTPHHTQD